MIICIKVYCNFRIEIKLVYMNTVGINSCRDVTCNVSTKGSGIFIISTATALNELSVTRNTTVKLTY